MDFGIVVSKPTAGSNAHQVIARFGNSGYSQPFWIVTNIHRRCGVHPSSMTVECRTAGWGGDAPLIAGIAVNGPMKNCKGYTPVVAYDNGQAVFRGYVVTREENLDMDGAAIEVLDARWLLEGGCIVGSFWSENNGKSVAYMQAIPAHFNKGGLPNRIKGNDKITYVFCPENYGILPGEGPSDPAANDADRATHWTPESIGVYLAETLDKAKANDIVNKGSTGGVGSLFPEYWYLPDDISLNPTEFSGLTSFISTLEAPTVGLMKANEVIFDSTPVNVALEYLVTQAGPFTIDIDMTDSFSYVTVVQSKNLDASGSVIPRAFGNVEKCNDGDCFGGTFKTDFRNHFTQVSIHGDEIYNETRCASSEKVKVTEQQAVPVELITDWKESLAQDAVDEYNRCVDKGVSITVQQVVEQFPNLFETWRLNDQIDFGAGTSESAYWFARVINRVPLPHLLTLFSAVANPKGDQVTTRADSKGNYNLTLPLPMWLEIGYPADTAYDPGTNPTIGPKNNGAAGQSAGNTNSAGLFGDIGQSGGAGALGTTLGGLLNGPFSGLFTGLPGGGAGSLGTLLGGPFSGLFSGLPGSGGFGNFLAPFAGGLFGGLPGSGQSSGSLSDSFGSWSYSEPPSGGSSDGG